MAACLVTVSGTSGEVLIKYEIGGLPYSLTSGIGTFYIESTATSVTYTTISGNAIATSLCLTIAPVVTACFRFNWKGIVANGYTITAVIIGNDTLNFTPIPFPQTRTELATAINSTYSDRIKAILYKEVIPIGATLDSQIEYNYIVKVYGGEVPILSINNADSTGRIYIYGTVSPCNVAGYDTVNTCEATI